MAPALLGSSGRHAWVLGTLAVAHARAGQGELARAVYDEMEARSRQEFVSPFWLCAAAAHVGLMEDALRHARFALEEREPMMVLFLRLAEFDLLRDQPLFDELRGRLRISTPDWAQCLRHRARRPSPHPCGTIFASRT